MHKLLILFFLVITTVSCARTKPTPFNWHAHVTTIAGDGSPLLLSDPFGVAIGNDGAVYISDAGEHNVIQKRSPDGKLMTLTGSNILNTPSGLAIDTAGSIYVADTGTNSIRKVTSDGAVSTIAGTGSSGYLDGPAYEAQFNGPIGVAVDPAGTVYVADSYNDRIRKISTDGRVTTVAGAGRPGYEDGDAANAQFDTPCAVAVSADGTLYVADTGNNQLRKITNGQVTTLLITLQDRSSLRSPAGLALTHDGFIYVSEMGRGTILQIAPDGRASVIAGNGSGYSGGESVRFNQPASLAIDPVSGDVIVADMANYLVRKLSHSENSTPESTELLPRLTAETLGVKNLLWPLDPQNSPHEVAATIGEVRGSFDSTDSRDHLHSGLDVFGPFGRVVRAIRSEKVSSPLPNWGFDELSEGLRVGVISYVHMKVGRDSEGKPFNDSRFVTVNSADGKLARVRVRRGTVFKSGEALGTVNRMYHVHLIIGPPGAEINPLAFSPVGFSDKIAPTIEKDGIQLFDESGNRVVEKQNGRLVVSGHLRIVVDAFDRTDMNSDRRRLGVYRLGYQVFQDGKTSDSTPDDRKLSPVANFAEPRVTIIFNRLPASAEATKLAYAADSGITVYGSKETRFLYEVTNTIRDGRATPGTWDTTSLPKGNYTLRIFAADYSGNETHNDLLLTIK
ncbi:MAG: gluconolaconase [Blastocatellia bacterium]|nr:MAG: gluconolaconase [Blastocatellia bacterium]